MHPGEQGVVAQVSEVGDAAFFRREVAHGSGQIDGGQACPGQAHGGFGVEVEAAHETLAAHDARQRGDGIDAKAKERVANARAQRFQIGPAVGDFAAQHANARRFCAELRHTQHHGVRPRLRSLHEGRDEMGRMLSVRVQRQGVGEAFARGLLNAVQHGGALALVGGQREHAQALILRGHVLQPGRAAVGAAVNHHPHGVPARARGGHGVAHFGAGVVAGDEHEMRARGGRRGGRGRSGFRHGAFP